ncbi:DNA-binding protein SMUBP-2-like [Brevipalpus obovatus]|uniref:DNA-binding protein SMUBP-2-like n=1 Tax=Brevipalpus obovatus TaxID=246614 RepID=UPI003D9DCA03
MISRKEFVDRHLALLELEKIISLQQGISRQVTIRELRLKHTQRNPGAWGILAVFESLRPVSQLFRLEIHPGDVLVVQKAIQKQYYTAYGTLKDVKDNEMTIIFKETVSLQIGDLYDVQSRPDRVTYERMQRALGNLSSGDFKSSTCDLDEILFFEKPLPCSTKPMNVKFFNENLNDSQKQAVRRALAQPKVALIYGPPGTGKTTTIVELIQQLKSQNVRVLVCAPSNIALDNILEKTIDAGVEGTIRLGNPGKTDPKLASRNLENFLGPESLVKSNRFTGSRFKREFDGEDTLIFVEKLNHKASKLRKALIRDPSCAYKKESNFSHLVRYKPSRDSRDPQSIKSMKSTELLLRNTIVFATLAGASLEGDLRWILEEDCFDVLIIDESSQALEAAAWIAIPWAIKVIFVGDPKQLPPVVNETNKDLADELKISIMERLMKSRRFEQHSSLLDVQYRMHEDLMEWPSKMFYKGLLKAHESVAKSTLDEISYFFGASTLVFIDTGGCDMHETESIDNFSCANEHEAKLVSYYVRLLVVNGVDQKSIGVITPYKLQVKVISTKLEEFSDVVVKSIDGFQGREKDVIVLSMVRSNNQGEVGFLQDMKRLNVATTRAKKHLAIIGDSSTISNHSRLKSLVDHLHAKAKVHQARNFKDKLDILESSDPNKLNEILRKMHI